MASLMSHLRHWFIPQNTNNYRAAILQNSSLLFVIGILIAVNTIIRIVETTPLNILGFSSSVTVDEVVSATNRERVTAGLKPLQFSEVLSDAARRKAANMFAEDYWAHNSPSGKSPWVWFNEAGYQYIHAGENLAKDFGNTDSMVSAWMSSPTHKANIVSDKYQEIGIAVVPGTLQGQETVLVVQLFGARSPSVGKVQTDKPAVAKPQVNNVQGKTIESVKQEPVEIMEVTESDTNASVTDLVGNKPFSFGRFDEYQIKKILGVGTSLLFLFALVVDLLIAESQSLSRRVGKNWGHIIFINVILLLVTIAHAGSIL